MITVYDAVALALLGLRATPSPPFPHPAGAPSGIECCVVSDRATNNEVIDRNVIADRMDSLPWTLSLGASLPHAAVTLRAPDDTVQARRKAITYSDGYGTRLLIHKRLGYAMLPLFALSYFSGDQLMKYGPDAPSWAIRLHGPSATGVAILFGANALTGVLNLWESRHDPASRKRRYLHTGLFMVASAGFTYAGSVLADEAETSASKRSLHRTINLVSMGVSTTSWLIMLIPHQ